MKSKLRLKWAWSDYLKAWRALCSGYALSVYQHGSLWGVEFDRVTNKSVTNDLRRPGFPTKETAMKWAEKRLLRLAKTEANRMARIMKRLGES